MLARLKSAFFVAPSAKRDAERFFMHIRDTEAYPTKQQLYGMLECAMGYSDEYEEEKKELEKAVSFGKAIRTPYTFYTDYEPGNIYNRLGWKSRFLNAGYAADENTFEDISNEEDEFENEYISMEFKTGFPKVSKNNKAKGKKPANTIAMYVIGAFDGSEQDARDIIRKELGCPATDGKTDVFNRDIKDVRFGFDRTYADGKTVSVGAHVYPDSYFAAVVVTETVTDGDFDMALDGFRYFYVRERAPFRRVGDLRTAQALFPYQTFEMADGSRSSKSPTMTIYYYLCDADFLLPIYGDEEWLEKLDYALDCPIYIYYFGDRKCMPEGRVNAGIWEEKDVSDKV